MIDRIARTFPALLDAGYKITSEPSERYNCIAWAAGDTNNWWWPDQFEQEFWPEGVPRAESLEAFLQAFENLGYEPCESGILEMPYEKVALFADAQLIPTHAAKQLPSGEWTSKLGAWEDISHDAVDGVAGESYGSVVRFMRRKR